MSMEFLWEEKYRPKKLDDIILPEDIRQTIENFIQDGAVPNFLLVGPQGVGKTTLAEVIVNELNAKSMKINCSLDRNVDTLRGGGVIMDYASSKAPGGKRKYAILDEMDNMNKDSTQLAFRAFLEKYSGNCGFIGTANYPSKIIDPLLSRFSVIEFNLEDDKADIMKQFMKRAEFILKSENVEYDKKALADIIIRHFPDFRSVVIALQTYAKKNGRIDGGVLEIEDAAYGDLFDFMKAKDYTNVRKWTAEFRGETNLFYEMMYANIKTVSPNHRPAYAVLLHDYMYRGGAVASKEINMSAFCADVMINCEFD